MKRQIFLLCALSFVMIGVLPPPGRSARLSDGQMHFVGSPRLVSTIAPYDQAYSTFATYAFTISVPADAGEAMGQVVITPRPSPDPVTFDLDATQAFEGSYQRPGDRRSLQSVNVDPENRAITVVFDQPVEPGKTIVIELSPHRNPMSGVYLYGVTAFPAGAQPHGRFLGYGRIHIYSRF